MSDGVNMRFGKGPFDRLRDRDLCTVSELAELAVISCPRVKDTAWILKAKNVNTAYAKLTLKNVQNLKVQME